MTVAVLAVIIVTVVSIMLIADGLVRIVKLSIRRLNDSDGNGKDL